MYYLAYYKDEEHLDVNRFNSLVAEKFLAAIDIGTSTIKFLVACENSQTGDSC